MHNCCNICSPEFRTAHTNTERMNAVAALTAPWGKTFPCLCAVTEFALVLGCAGKESNFVLKEKLPRAIYQRGVDGQTPETAKVRWLSVQPFLKEKSPEAIDPYGQHSRASSNFDFGATWLSVRLLRQTWLINRLRQFLLEDEVRFLTRAAKYQCKWVTAHRQGKVFPQGAVRTASVTWKWGVCSIEIVNRFCFAEKLSRDQYSGSDLGPESSIWIW